MYLHNAPMNRLLVVIVSLAGITMWATPLPAGPIEQSQMSFPREGVALGLLTQVPPLSYAAREVIAGGITATVPSITGIWRENVHPGTHDQHAVAYDEARGRLVLFGGKTSQGYSPHTYEWDGQKWHRVTPVSPPPRHAHKMIYDAARQRVLLFGGKQSVGSGRVAHVP